MPVTVDRREVARLLRWAGLKDGNPDGEWLRLRRRTHRPGRRAVYEVTWPGGRAFVKAVRPHLAAALHERHVLLHDAGVPVPRSLAWSERGLVLMEALDGAGLRQQLGFGGPAPAGESLVRLLDRLPEGVMALRRRSSWSQHVVHHARELAKVLPQQAARVADLAAEILAAVGGLPADQPTHGDLHEGQLLVRGPWITGLLDLDRVGPGRRADDLGCAIAHLHVLRGVYPSQGQYLTEVADGWLRAGDHVVDRTELRYCVAGVLISLATGPHRVGQPDWERSTRRRIDLAEEWVRSARSTSAPRRMVDPS